MNNSYNLNLDGIMDGHLKTLYRGIITEKSPFDYVMYQMIINEIKPDLIIEIGTNYGGSCLYLGDILNNIGKGMVHTVDIQDETFLSNSEEKRGLINRHPRIQRFLGGYQEYNLDYASSFEKIMLIEDGSHNYNDVLSVMNKFKDLISEDSYMIVEDGTVNWMDIEKNYDGGPLRAIEEFLPQNPQFEIDRKWCDFYGYNATFNPNGYLKRTKKMKQSIFKWNIQKEEASDSLRFFNPNGKIVLDLGCGRHGGVEDPEEYTPIFAFKRGAISVIGVDEREEEKEYYENYFSENFPEAVSFFYTLKIESADQVRDLIKKHNINYLKSDIEGFETIFYDFEKEDLENIETFILEYHSFDIKERFIEKFREWDYRIYANGEAWVEGIGVLFAEKLKN